MKKIFLFIFLSLLPHSVSASDIHITEVLFNPTGADTGGEYIVLKNISATSKDLTGWQLYPDGIGYFTFSSFSLDGGASVKILLRQSGSNTANVLYHSGATANMGNTAGSVALFSSTQHDASTLVDFVQYGRSGETWETSADEAALWIKGEFVATSADAEGIPLRRIDNTHTATAWATGTAEVASEPPPTSTEEDSKVPATSGGKVSSGPSFMPKIRAFAGSDRASIAGAEVVFSGRALDAEDQLIEGQLVRYVWNFGDGMFADGKNISHVYQYPGIYSATLMITQGEEMMQDDCMVRVGDNTVFINEVMPGGQGWIELANTASAAVDISKWYLTDADGAQFVLPLGTRMAGGSFIVLSNSTTKLLQNTAKSFSIKLHYQNGKEANIFTYAGAIPAGMSVARTSRDFAIGKGTPGLANSEQKLTKSVPQAPKMATIPLPKPLIDTVAQRVETSREDVRVADQQASILSSSVKDGNKEIQWLFWSIVAGLFAGAGLTVAIHARRFQR